MIQDATLSFPDDRGKLHVGPFHDRHLQALSPRVFNMKSPNRATVSNLRDLPNVGEATATDFAVLGISHPQQLIDADGIALYHSLCEKTGVTHDPCMADVFMSTVDFMNGGDPQPWWAFTARRKARLLEDH